MVAGLSELIASVQVLPTKIKSYVDRKSRKVYTPQGLIEVDVKEWYGVTMAKGGVFNLDISSAGFTEILHVEPQVIYDSEQFSEQTIAALNRVSRTRVEGRVITGSKKGFSGRDVATVMVKVTGT
jgi:hypothetical protein